MTYFLPTFLAATLMLMISINSDPSAINIQVKPLNDDLIWTDEKDMVGVYLPDKVKKNGKATGFRDLILENSIQVAFNRFMEKIRNPELYKANWMGLHDPMKLNEKIDMNKKEDLYE